MKSSKYTPPSLGKTDAAHAITRAGLGAIPFAGGAAIELFNAVVVPPIAKRQLEWMEKVGSSLLHIERALGIDLESLHSNDQFIDIALQSSHIALRTSQETKLEALKNAILNSAVGLSIDDSMTHMFLGYLDSFAPWHLKLLKFFNSRYTAVTSNHNVGTDYFIENEFPELIKRKDFYALLGKELHSHGLINNANFKSPPSKGLPRTKATEMGCEFLTFIKSPIKNEA